MICVPRTDVNVSFCLGGGFGNGGEGVRYIQDDLQQQQCSQVTNSLYSPS